jgi:hypothetical protein
MKIMFYCHVTVYSLVYVNISTRVCGIRSWEAIISIASNLLHIEMKGPSNGNTADPVEHTVLCFHTVYNRGIIPLKESLGVIICSSTLFSSEHCGKY